MKLLAWFSLLPATSAIAEIDHLSVPIHYDNIGGKDFLYGQTFLAEDPFMSGTKLYIGDPTRPDDSGINALVGPANIRVYDAASLTNPVLLSNSPAVAANATASGLTTFNLTKPVATKVGRRYFACIESTDAFGIGLTELLTSSYEKGAEAYRISATGEIVLHPTGRDLSFAVLNHATIPPSQLPTGTPPDRSNSAIKLPAPNAVTTQLNFAFPLRSGSKIYLNTEPGGASAFDTGDGQGYYDHFHANNEAYYSIDLDVNAGKADVIAAKAGTIVRVLGAATTTTVDNVVDIDHGNGYYTEYREFTLSPEMTTAAEGTVITAAQALQGFKLGKLLSASPEHLHFQIEHSDTTPPHVGPGQSQKTNAALSGVMSGGVSFDPVLPSFRMNRDTTGPLVSINGQPGQRPLQTEIVGVLPTTPIPVLSGIDVGSLPAFTKSATGVVGTPTGVLTLKTGSPVWAAGYLQVDSFVNTISFEVDFTSVAGAEGLLSIYWDGELVGTLDERYAGPGLDLYAFDLPGDFEAGFYALAFRLDPFTGDQSTATISNISVGVVPEPAIASATLLTALGLITYRSRSRDHRKF